MKKITLILISLIFAFLTNAQEHKNQFETSFSLASIKDTPHNYTNIGGNFTYDRLLLKRLGMGAGIGYNYIKLTHIDGGKSTRNFSSIPLYLDVRYIETLSRVVKLILVFDGGIVANINDNYLRAKNITGYLSPQAGFNFRITPCGTHLGLRFVYKRFTSLDFDSIGGQLSITF